jgi:hypothetical protein
MSRGWESKSVEGQQAEAQVAPAAMPTTGKPQNNIASDAESKRRRQELELQRERVLSERTSSPHRRSALAAALIDIEEKLTELGWAIHL